jgi:hypothetical protein
MPVMEQDGDAISRLCFYRDNPILSKIYIAIKRVRINNFSNINRPNTIFHLKSVNTWGGNVISPSRKEDMIFRISFWIIWLSYLSTLTRWRFIKKKRVTCTKLDIYVLSFYFYLFYHIIFIKAKTFRRVIEWQQMVMNWHGMTEQTKQF